MIDPDDVTIVAEKTTIDELLTGTFREKDRQINFAIEELEKIKAEIDTLRGCYNPRFKERLVLQSDVIQILNKYISELKGE